MYDVVRMAYGARFQIDETTIDPWLKKLTGYMYGSPVRDINHGIWNDPAQDAPDNVASL